jgi:SAM-dependent methyltransferase
MDFKPMADEGIHAKVVELLTPLLSQSTRMLVAGAGQGGLEHELALSGKLANNILAADIHPHGYLMQGIRCVACDLNDSLPFENESLDVVVATEVIEHLNNPRNLIDEAGRILTPGGRLVLSTPNAESFAQRVRFLFSGRFDYFSENDFKGSGHLHPIFNWLLERWYRDLFTLEVYDSYSFHLRVPGVARIPMPKKRLFAPVNVYVLRRRPFMC